MKNSTFLRKNKISSFFFFFLFFLLFHNNILGQAPGGVSDGLVLWLKSGNGIVNSGTNVTGWNDQSGGGRNLTTTTAAYQPQLVSPSAIFNFNPSLNFNGDFLRYTGSVLPRNSGASIFTILNQTTQSGYNTVWDFFSNDPTLNTYGNQWIIYHGGRSTAHSIRPVNGKTMLVSAHWQHNISASTLLEIDGKAEPVARAITTNGNNYYLGAGNTGGAEPWRGNISENIVYSSPLSGIDLAKVNSYLAIKYGITLDGDPGGSAINYNYLSADATIIWNGILNSIYHHNITGIGRDDASQLLQLKSKSINREGLLTIEAEAFSSNGSFFLMGDNAASISLTNTYSPNSFTPVLPYFRTGKVWKVQETGTAGIITITLAGFSATHMLVHSSADFGTGTPLEIPVVNGKVEYDFSDGQYFTFAAPATGPGGIHQHLAVWLKADAGTGTSVTGTAVSSWNDQSGNNRTHTQATASSQPIFVGEGADHLFSYNPALRFTGVANGNVNNKYMVVPNYLNTTDAVHVFTVSRINGVGVTSWQTLYSFTSDLTHPDWYLERSSMRVGGTEKSSPARTIKYALAAALMPKSGNQRHFWNGIPTNFSNTTYNITAAASPNFTVGVDRNNTDPFTGDIHEVIVYAEPAGGDLPLSHIQQIQSYLAIKYGITLDHAQQPDYIAGDGSTRFWTGADNMGYHHHIFGIGRDALSSFNQKQAYSYSDSSIAVYLGSLAGLNSLNTASIDQDNAYLVFGNNNADGYSSVDFISGTAFQNMSSTERINTISNKVWKAQATTIGSWMVNIKTTRFSNAKYVMVSNDVAFEPADTRIYAVVNGHAQDVLVNDGEYIRIASFNTAPGGVYNGLALWLRSDIGVNGSPVVEWMDQSGNGRDLIQENTTYSPSGAAASATGNFNPAVHFNGTALYRSQNFVPTAAGTGISVFSAARTTSVAVGYKTLWDFSSNSPTLNVNGTNWVFWNMGGNHTVNVIQNRTNIANTHWVVGSSGTRINEVDGYTVSITGNVAAPATNDYLIGAGSRTNNEPWQGDIFENVVYANRITGNDLLKVNTYLSLKYGVTLKNTTTYQYMATDGTVIWDGATNSAFHHNIAGIGRDDIELLNQKQSNSINQGTQITIGLENIATNNESNQSIFANDISYLIWGDNGVTNNNTTTLAYTAIVNINHLNRKWKVQNSNMLQKVRILFPAALQPGLLSGPCDNYKLIISSSETFTAGSITSIEPVSIENGDFIAEYAFPAGFTYFTLARVDPSSDGSVYLPEEDVVANNYSSCTVGEWMYFYEDAIQDKKLFATADFSNAELDNLTVSITTSGVSYASAVRETSVMPRITTITDATAATYAGGKVRIYYDQDELSNTQVEGALTNGWFKYSGNAVDALSDIIDDGVFVSATAIAVTPDASGIEDGVNYVEFHNITSFSSFMYVSSTEITGVVLPVTIESFNAAKDGASIRLQWTTVSESDNKGFEVQKSGGNGQWTTIGFVSSSAPGGKSNTKINYHFTDHHPSEGMNAYRLKQIDFDEQIQFSAVVYVSYNGTLKLNVLPNPVNNLATVTGLRAGDRIHLYNQSGQLIYTTVAGGDQLKLDMSAYGAGLYYLQTIRNKESATIKVLKVK